MPLSIVTAVIPLAKLAMSIIPSNIDTPARIPIATDIANIVAETFAICPPSPILRIDTSFLRRNTNPVMNAAPLIISSTDSRPTSLQTPASIASENETLSNKPLSLAICCFLPILVAVINSLTKNTKAVAKAAPFSISSADSCPASLQTPTIKVIATAIPITILPTLATLLPELFATLVIELTKTANAAANAAPFSISSADSLPMSLHTVTISIIAKDSLSIILPILLIFLMPSWSDSLPMACKKTIIPPMIPARPIKPCFASSGFKPLIILTAAATRSIAIPIFSSEFCTPSMFTFLDSASNATEADDNLLIAIDKPISTPASTIITPTAFHNLPISFTSI